MPHRARLVLGLVTTFGACIIAVFIQANQVHAAWQSLHERVIGEISIGDDFGHRWGRNGE